MRDSTIRTNANNGRRSFVTRTKDGDWEVTFLGAHGKYIVQEAETFDEYAVAIEEAEAFTNGTVTNVERIVTLMEWSGPTGPLIQPFVITAIEKYAEMVIEAGPQACDSALLSGAAWVATAQHALAKMEAQ